MTMCMKILKMLDRKNLFKNRDISIYVFSKSGFTEACYELANLYNVYLVDFETMCQ